MAGAHLPLLPAAWPGLEQLVPPLQAPLLPVAPLRLPQATQGLLPWPLLGPGQLRVLDPSQLQLIDPAQLQLLDTCLPVLDVQQLFAASGLAGLPALAVPQLLVASLRPGLLPAAGPLVGLPAAPAAPQVQGAPAGSQMQEIVAQGPLASGKQVSLSFNAKDVSALN